MTALERALILFARLPRLGQVKTRLSPRFGLEEAYNLHRALLSDSLELLRRCGEMTSAQCHLYLSEEGDLDEEILAGLGRTRIRIQRGADLGERLLHAFQERLEGGHSHCVVLGSDSPHLPFSYVARAFEELGKSEIVVGPARDGGYYLLGATRPHASLLTGMPWGTAQVYRETVRRARAQGIPIASLPAWYDVDLPESVLQLWKDLCLWRSEGRKEMPRCCFTLLEAWAREGRLGQDGDRRA